MLIKDHMRDHCVPDLVESWLWIMVMSSDVSSSYGMDEKQTTERQNYSIHSGFRDKACI